VRLWCVVFPHFGLSQIPAWTRGNTVERGGIEEFQDSHCPLPARLVPSGLPRLERLAPGALASPPSSRSRRTAHDLTGRRRQGPSRYDPVSYARANRW
jgi:hypothetical protein